MKSELKTLTVSGLFFYSLCLSADPHPIQFSIPESKIMTSLPEKDRDFAFIVPGRKETYIYDNESDYYRDYQRSLFAITTPKAGWDCMRHYEILANGCIPYFVDLEKCHKNTMTFLPKDLILEAMNLPGVHYPNIDYSKFDRKKYDEILEKLLDHTRKFLTTKNMAKYVLEKINYQGSGKILYLSQNLNPDYMRELVLIGLKELYGSKVVDFPKIPYLYKTYSHDIRGLYGKGISYTKILDDPIINRDNIQKRIQNREFDLIVFGSFHRGLPFIELIQQNYPPEKIVFICGEDLVDAQGLHQCPYNHIPNFFLREFDCLNKK